MYFQGCYAVVDLYGVVEKISITSTSSLSNVEPVRAPSVSSSSESDSEKEVRCDRFAYVASFCQMS